MLTEKIQKHCDEWLDQEWPLWRQATDTGLIHKLRRTYEAAYIQGCEDEGIYRDSLHEMRDRDTD